MLSAFYRPASRRGFGLLELMTTLAFLTVVMGVMVSLARYVRGGSAERITRMQLRGLDVALAARRYVGPVVDDVPSVAGPGDERAWAAYVASTNPLAVAPLAESSDVINDAWGNPIGYLGAAQLQIGMAPHDRPFFFSAGPDGRYLTQDDNLYSYEQITATPPATAPAGGGHNE